MNVWSADIGDIASLVTAAVSLAGVGFAIVQVRASQASQREATAKSIWMMFELRALDHPRFAYPSSADIDYDARTFDGDADKFNQYESFVSFLLLACDEALRLGGKDWENGVDDNLAMHWEYLGGPLFAPYMKNMSPLMRRRLEHVRVRISKMRGKS